MPAVARIEPVGHDDAEARLVRAAEPRKAHAHGHAPVPVPMHDYYRVLGLARGASAREVGAAYRAHALLYHPDKRARLPPGLTAAQADALFALAREAHHALLDPAQRAALDLRLLAEDERRARNAQLDARRRQLRDALLASERQAASGAASPSVQVLERRPTA